MIQQITTLIVGVENGNCKLASPSFIEWDAMTVCLESVMHHIRTSPDAKHDIQAGITLLSNVLQFQTEVLVINCFQL